MSDKKREIMSGGRTKFKKQISESSKRYLMRQAKDPYVKEAIKYGYVSRAAFKLKEMNEKNTFIKPGMRVVDLGAAPGGWCQVCKEIMGPHLGGGKLIALDKIWMDDISGVTFIKGDFTSDDVYEKLMETCPDKVDVVLSDIAPETSGHEGTDHLRIMALAEMAVDFAYHTLKPGGAFVAKLFQGGEEAAFRDAQRAYFDKVKFEKPPSSRKESKEIFIVCTGFRGHQ